MTSIGTVLTGNGKVIRRRVSAQGLHTMVVEQVGRYPDLELWSEMVLQGIPQGDDIKCDVSRVTWRHWYSEKVNAESGIVRCFLWIFWKDV